MEVKKFTATGRHGFFFRNVAVPGLKRFWRCWVSLLITLDKTCASSVVFFILTPVTYHIVIHRIAIVIISVFWESVNAFASCHNLVV